MQQFHVLQLTAEEAKREATIAEALKKHGLPGNLAKRAKDDPTAPFYFLDELTALAAAEPPVWERLRAQLKVAGTRLGALDRLIHASDKAGGDTRRTQAGDLMGIVDDGCGLFHDGESNGFADVENDGHRETWPVRSQGFSRWLRHRYFEKHNGAPNNEALQSALGTIESMAQFEGESMSVHRRVASTGQQLYLDLGDPAWRAVEIGLDGWHIIDRPPVRFIRSGTARVLPEPKSGSSIDALRPYLNLSSDDDFVLAVAWVLAAMRASGPYPVLVLSGEQGSAKSTCARLLHSLIDPHKAPLRGAPRNEQDLFIAARNAHVLAFDNLSAVPAWLSDALCRISTGGGFASRQLYTNIDEVVIEAERPLILNGIDDIVVRGDLADRALFLTLTAIAEADRKREAELFSEFEREKPRILGALLDALSLGLKRLPEVRLERLPRMADFAAWAVACETAMFEAGTFMDAYQRNRHEVVSAVIDASPVASAIRELMRSRQEPWEGPASKLYDELNRIAGERQTRTKAWPGNPQALSRSLNRIGSALRPAGLVITKKRTTTGRWIVISCRPD